MSRIEILIADSAGFCFGVRRGVEQAESLAAGRDGRRLVSLGPLIHNPPEVERLRGLGVEPGAVSDVSAGDLVLLRTHGVPLEQRRELEGRGAEVHDATCPYVRSAQTLAARAARDGYAVVLVGDPGHPEALSILSHARAAGPEPVVLVAGAADLEGAPLAGARKVAVLAQTTLDPRRLGEVVQALVLERHVEVRVHNTICDATADRQREARALAARADAVLVVGGHGSANTRRLVELCSAIQPRTHLVEAPAEIDPAWLRDVRRVAITAGASTPRAAILSVAARLAELGGGAAGPNDPTTGDNGGGERVP